MSEVNQRIAQLSPDQSIALEQRLLARRNSVRARGIPKRPVGVPAPLSFAQERLWFLSNFEPDSTAYNEMHVARMRGDLNIEALERSLDAVAARHDSLRICVGERDGVVIQVDNPLPPTRLPIYDLSMVSADERMASAMDTVGQLQAEPFDLGQAPLWRAALVRLADDDHLFVRVVHHMVSDGWSGSILWREIGHYYREFCVSDAPSELPALGVDYGDYAAWQRAQLQGEHLEAQVEFWRAKLNGVAPLELPTDRPRPLQLTHRGKVEKFVVDQDVLESLTALARANRVSLYIILLTAFQVLLHRYSGQDDITVGSPVANRTRSEVEDIIGFFVNTLVLRADCSGNPTFRTLLEQVRKYALDAYGHQDTPFEKLVEELSPARELNRNPLFDVFFALQNMPQSVVDLHGLNCERLRNTDVASKFDLSLYLTQNEGALHGQLEYALDLFNQSTILRLIGHFQTLLKSIIANPDSPIDDLTLLTAHERDTLLYQWNDTAVAYRSHATIHGLFQAQAAKTPQAVAVTDRANSLTFAAVDAASNHLAHQLLELGVRPGEAVGVLLERSADLVIAMLAVVKAGAAWLPLDPSNPAERLAWMAADAGISKLISTAALAATLGETSYHRILLDDMPSSHDKQPVVPPGVAVTGADVAYYLYTSGSTGRPKGIVATHRGALNRFEWMWQTYPFAAGEAACQRAAASFVDSVWEIFGPLLQGCPIVIAPDATVRDPKELVAFLAEHKLSRVTVVPALLTHLLDVYAHRAPDAWAPRLWICSGETLPAHLVNRFGEVLPEARLLNLYGSSEVAGDVTWWDAQDHDRAEGIVPIGRPIANTQIYILDTRQQPVPIGVTGELYAGGDGIALGYLNQPELSAERFLDNPFGTNPGDRLFRTGDLARYREDGHIEYLGRKDRQVKIRGFRVEPGEIEAVLANHARVQTAVVGVRDDAQGTPSLVCWWKCKADQSIDSEQLRSYLRTQLPDYMVPQAFVEVEEFPTTTSGKIDLKRLPDPVVDQSSSAEAPNSALEMQLLSVWRQVLGRKQIGVEDNFFDVGGHSLLAVRLLSKVAAATGKELPIASLFYGPTIRQQAALLMDEGWEPTWKALVPIKAGGTHLPLFLVPPVATTSVRIAALADYLEPEQPLFSFNPPGIDGKDDAIDSVEEIAATYLAEARKVQPEGPYLFGGICFGAHVALEMAQQAQKAGEHAPVVIVIDADHPRNGPTWGSNAPRQPLSEILRQTTRSIGSGKAVHYVSDKTRRKYRRLRVQLRQRLMPNGKQINQVWRGHAKAHNSYVAKPFQGKLILLQSEQLAKKALQNHWEDLAAGGLERVLFAGTTHMDLLRDRDRVAAELTRIVEEYVQNVPR